MGIYGRDFAAIYDQKWGFWGPKVWPFIRKIIKGRRPGSTTWLDLCCGAGSLLKFAFRKGFLCTGVDASPFQIRYAKKNIPNARFIRKDIRYLSLSEAFDIVTCMFDSLNYITTTAGLSTVFRKAARHLGPNGVFIFDMNTYEGLEDTWNTTSCIDDPANTIIIKSSFDRKSALGSCVITGFIRKGRAYKRFQENHIERGYTRREIERCLRSAGFQFKAFDGHSLASPRKRSGRLLYVCDRSGRKPSLSVFP